jgi:ribonuclease HI
MSLIEPDEVEDMQNFIKCFKKINTNNPYIINNENINIWFTDGSCTNNGKKLAIGGSAAICVSGYKKGLLLYNKVDNKIIKATNIRAEGIAIMNIFENLLKSKKSPEWRQSIIYTDSNFWIKMIYEYMPKWKPANFDTKANSDLTKQMWDLWQQLQLSPKIINIIHVYSHNKQGDATSVDPFKRFTHDNNDLADILANMARKLPDYKIHEEIIR